MLISPETLQNQLQLNEVTKVVSVSEKKTVNYGKALGKVITPPAVVFLYGEPGSGKTYFTKGIAGFFGIDRDTVCSPTFIIAREHHCNSVDLFHIDLYRIRESVAEIEYLDFFSDISEKSVFVIEWAPDLSQTNLFGLKELFSSAFSVSLKMNTDETRGISFERLF